MENREGKMLKLRSDLTLVSIDGAYALLDVERKCYYEPDETAYFLLKLMEEGFRYEELVAELVFEYDVPEDRATCDLDSFISELSKLGLVEMRSSALGAQRERRARATKKLYTPPDLLHREELAVSAAQTPITVTEPNGGKWV